MLSTANTLTNTERHASAPLDYLASLNSNQRRAVEFGCDSLANSPPLLVIAGAGSGKTNTLAHRVAHLIVSGADPRRIMLLTFGRRAAEEMAHRAEAIVGKAMDKRSAALAKGLSWSGTFHAIGARLIREYAREIGLEPNFTIHDRGDAADLMNLVRHDLGFSKTKDRFPSKSTSLEIYSAVIGNQKPLTEVLKSSFPWCSEWEDQLKEMFRRYVEAKQTQNVLDYDDLLLYWDNLLKEPEIGRDIAGRFDHVLVDEYQDTNRLQASILTNLCPNGRGLTVVGDDAQSIYSFRGATIRNILEFPESFSPNAEVITLDRNYRSTQPILEAANAVIGLAKERFTKNLWTDRISSDLPKLVNIADDTAQATYIVDTVLENREYSQTLKDQAVLFRASHHSAALEIELTHRNVPFRKFGGLKFLEAAHIKDALAILRWSQNLRNEISGFRVAQLLPKVGPGTARKLLDAMTASIEPIEALKSFNAPKGASAHWNEFSDLIGSLHLNETTWPSELDLVRQWYAPLMENKFEDFAYREADLRQLVSIAATHPSRERFLTEFTLDPPNATSAEPDAPILDEDYLTLSTIHSAKGQEWSSVFMLNTVDGCIPADLAVGESDEIEEERRLLYVAMTRAKEQLHLMIPQRFYTYNQRNLGDNHVYGQRTRFIPRSLVKHFEEIAWPPNHTGSPVHRNPFRKPADVKARMRSMWA